MNPGEPVPSVEVVKPIRRSIILLGIRMFLVLFLLDTVYALLILIPLFGYVSAEWNPSYVAFLLVVHTMKNLLLSYLLITQVGTWFGTLYYVSGGHLIQQRGLLNTTDIIYQLTDIQSVVMRQPWLGRFLNFGNVTISFTVGREKEVVLLYAITNPRLYEELFSEFV
jgi:uncharacterized membrane protein YdbT with pleckstrin-like domain